MGESPVRGGAVWVLCVGVSLIDREWLRCWVGCVGCEESVSSLPFLRCLLDVRRRRLLLLGRVWESCSCFSVSLAWFNTICVSSFATENSAGYGNYNTQVSIDRKYDIPSFEYVQDR